MSKLILIAVVVTFVALAIVGLGISVAVIHAEGSKFIPDDQSCQEFPSGDYFKAKKQIWDRWHWTYEFENIDGKIQMTCPTSKHDADLYLNGELVARTEIKYFSTVSRNNIKNCTGDTVYVTRTSGTLGTLINMNGITVSFELRDAKDEKVLAYVEGDHFFNDEYDIKDMNGETVAHLYRQYFSIPWYWEFTIYKPGSPGADMRVLSLLAGMKSFEPTDDDNSGDMCNQYFWTTGILILVVVCLIVLGVLGAIGLGVYFLVDRQRSKSDLN